MNEPDLPSDSDVSDEDYCPSGGESGGASQEESGPDNIDDLNENSGEDDNECDTKKTGQKRGKNKRKVKRKSLKRKAAIEESSDSVNGNDCKWIEKELNPEEEKKKSDSLWADFLKDCGGPVKKKPSLDCHTGENVSKSMNGTNSVKESTASSDKKTSIVLDEKENKSKITEIFEFAGEEIRVEKEVPSNSISSNNGTTKSPVTSTSARSGRGSGGASSGGGRGGTSALTSFLGQLGKKGKLSTLEKSKLDWDQFKKNEGIEEEIQIHNKGKDGYLEKQDFLQRTDLRRFEIEKAFRQKRSGR